MKLLEQICSKMGKLSYKTYLKEVTIGKIFHWNSFILNCPDLVQSFVSPQPCLCPLRPDQNLIVVCQNYLIMPSASELLIYRPIHPWWSWLGWIRSLARETEYIRNFPTWRSFPEKMHHDSWVKMKGKLIVGKDICNNSIFQVTFEVDGFEK